MKALNGIKEVFSKPFYVLIAVTGMLLFYLLNVIVSDFYDLKEISNNYSSWTALKLTFNYFIGFPKTIDSNSVFFIFLIAFLFGSYIALATYKTSQIRAVESDVSIIGSLGVFFGFIATGCVACGIGIASILGFGGAFLILPFEGFEISIISFSLLLYANWSIAKKIGKKICPISK